MSITPFIEYEDATEEVRLVYEDIMATRGSDWVNNFWKALATQPELLRRTWEGVKFRSEPTASEGNSTTPSPSPPSLLSSLLTTLNECVKDACHDNTHNITKRRSNGHLMTR